jgi:acyl CoA:acetate/3-ketoacid CoA transferase
MKRLQAQDASQIAMVNDPFTGGQWLALKPLLPDVSIVQVQIADDEGNAWILGPRWDNAEQVKASKRTIVIAEEIVSTEVIRREPERTVIPGFLVSHVVEMPFAAHPTSVYRSYDYDAEQIEAYVEATNTPASFREYLDRYVYDVKDHWEYLERVGGMKRLSRLRADAILGY